MLVWEDVWGYDRSFDFSGLFIIIKSNYKITKHRVGKKEKEKGEKNPPPGVNCFITAKKKKTFCSGSKKERDGYVNPFLVNQVLREFRQCHACLDDHCLWFTTVLTMY